MKIGNIEIKKEHELISVIIFILALGLSIYIIFFAPLSKVLNKKYHECKAAELNVLNMRNVIASASEQGEKILIKEEDAARGIDELAKRAKSKGIRILSMKPQAIRVDADMQCKILPIAVELDANYEQLGTLLGSIEKFQKSLLKVENFSIVPDSDNKASLYTRLTINMYISGDLNE